MSEIINGLGIQRAENVLSIFLSEPTFDPSQWIFTGISGSWTPMFYKNPLKVKGISPYDFSGNDGFYFASNPGQPAFPNGYRYIWYVFIGFLPYAIAGYYNASSTYPGGGSSDLYYPINWNTLEANFNSNGINQMSRSQEESISGYMGQFLTGNYGWKYLTNERYNIFDDTFDNNTQNLAECCCDLADCIILDTFGITHDMLGYTSEAIEACSQLPKPQIINSGYPVCCFQPAKYKNTNNIGDKYRPIEMIQNVDGTRVFNYINNVILNENTPNICYYPFNVILYPQCLNITNAQSEIVRNNAIALVFQGVEPI